ncbi:hypothetical protein BDD43_5188 [Mucilaginibacter gracilis]|uniref:Uncharacterized protein n=1 Tax=Mucilaginibacter gracilis TaxID=423350 RepID=A0A495J7G9_9SPHI|nr:hypothetical protein [Mucilaginibacter gracilis]RKR84935.1 hypothetical protein BDD43_5188 [Mucilaginibacter gracilis]
MKFKISLLLIASIGIFIWGAFYAYNRANSNSGPLPGILIMILGILCFGAYFILCIILRLSIRTQVTAEVMLIGIIAFSCYKLTRKVVLHVPGNFKGSIILVYGVDNQPRLQPRRFFYRNIDINVPQSGIILISNRFAEKYINNIFILDSLHHHTFEVLSQSTDTILCNKKPYIADVFNYAYPPPTLTFEPDTAEQALKKAEAVKQLEYRASK